MKQYRYWQLLCTCFILSLVSHHVLAEEGEYHKVTAPEVQGMMKNKDVIIINTLSKLEYELQHIPGSINIPIDTITGSNLLPLDKNTPLVFYCMATL